MVDTFGDLCRDAYDEKGVMGVVGRWIRALVEVTASAVGSRGDERRARVRDEGPRLEAQQAGWAEVTVYNVRYGLRALARQPRLSLTVVAILGIGIGATTSVFSIADGLVLKRLDLPEADRLVFFDEGSHTVPEFQTWLTSIPSVEPLVGIHPSSQDLVGIGEPARVRVAGVTPEYFMLLGGVPSMGRLIVEADAVGPARVVVLSHRLWTTRFGADPSIVGRSIRLNNEVHEVVGVANAEFRPPLRLNTGIVDLWTPLEIGRPEQQDSHASYLRVFGRLAPGASISGVQAEVDRSIESLEARYPENYAWYGQQGRFVPVTTLHAAEVSGVATPAYALFGAVALMLLIACVTVANLLLAWARNRAGELRIRAALGASRARLLSQLLTESVLLSGTGGAVGVVIAYFVVGVSMAAAPADLPGVGLPSVDGRVLIFATAVSVGVGLVFGLIPALISARLGTDAVVGSVAGNPRTRGRIARFGSLLVISEIGLSLVLLIGAGLLFNSFLGLARVDPGFDPEPILAMELGLEARYTDEAEKLQFSERMLDELRAVPQVSAAAAAVIVPFMESGFCCRRSFAAPQGSTDSVRVSFHPVSKGFFETMGVGLLEGEDLPTSVDAGEAVPVVVTATTGARLFPNGNALGAAIDLMVDGGTAGRVVGVVDDFRFFSLANQRLTVFVPFDPYGPIYRHQQFAISIRGDREAAASAIRQAVWSVDASLPVTEIHSLSANVDRSLFAQRLMSASFGGFALFALLLAAGGIWGTTAYVVSQRQHELGIRLALGADPSGLVRTVLLRGANVTLIGLALGLIGAFALSEVLASLIFGIAPQDPFTFMMVTLLMGFVATTATYVPARRAARVDPRETLTSS